jgi:predicted alpha/beta-fold hydrolase
VTVSGGRWRCASCEQFLAYQDLQLCGLTEAALERYGKEASSARDRVEFRGKDKTFHLLEENKRRYQKKRPLPNVVGLHGDTGSSQRPKQQRQEVMEIIID